MAETLLEQIEKAEQQADEIRAQAAREARDIIKSVEEASAAMSRQAVKEMHEAASRTLEEARISTQDEIKTLEMRRSAERESLKKLAQARVSKAGRAIFERVVADGAR